MDDEIIGPREACHYCRQAIYLSALMDFTHPYPPSTAVPTWFLVHKSSGHGLNPARCSVRGDRTAGSSHGHEPASATQE